MRKCARCRSVGFDEDSICGVCGSSLTEAPSISLEEVGQDQDQNQPLHLRRHVGKGAIAGLLTGIGLIVSGVFGLYFIGFWGFGLIVPGMFLLVSAIDTISGEPYRPSFSGESIRPSGSGRQYMNREADREEAEERNRESGAAD
ncbi:MAG TPA: hypothetical protein VEL52_05075 [Candidatus Bathyarchaeia archaeon]|nr:hypothetical protein [Candidatus Bathyarchaeia archaeon]